QLAATSGVAQLPAAIHELVPERSHFVLACHERPSRRMPQNRSRSGGVEKLVTTGGQGGHMTQRTRPRRRQSAATLALACGVAALALAAAPAATAAGPFIDPLNNRQTLASTVPKNGDVNPYGVAVVPTSAGRLTAGDVLVSNFNNHRNLQGTGTSIVEVSPSGGVSVFAALAPNKLPGACPGGLGLTTGLVALRSGWVIVGSLPTKDGSSATMQAGCLIVLDSAGNPVETISGSPINGPWDMTALDGGSMATLFVTSVLNGTVAGSPNTVHKG